MDVSFFMLKNLPLLGGRKFIVDINIEVSFIVDHGNASDRMRKADRPYENIVHPFGVVLSDRFSPDFNILILFRNRTF